MGTVPSDLDIAQAANLVHINEIAEQLGLDPNTDLEHYGKHVAKINLEVLEKLQDRLREFAQRRNWEQFHAPKNLAMALSVEAAELLEHFQWLSEQQSEQLPADKLEQIGFELADVFIYTVRLADRLGVDLDQLVQRKIQINEQKYPVEKVYGSARKYTEY